MLKINKSVYNNIQNERDKFYKWQKCFPEF